MNVTLIGMGSGQPESLTLQSLAALRQADLILGARRLMAALPAGCTANRAAAYRADEVAELLHTSGAENAVLVYSGDTGFYSGAAALLDKLSALGIRARVLPGLSSVQLLAAALGRPWQEWNLVSAHGRACDPVAECMQGRPAFFLTGGSEDPATLCAQLAAEGFGEVEAVVGQCLGTPEEKLFRGRVQELAAGRFDSLSVLLVEAAEVQPRRTPGLPVLLVVEPKGQSLTLAAELRGLDGFRTPSHLAGILLNNCTARMHALLAPMLEAETGLPVLGFLPKLPEAVIGSRHLGLYTAAEVEDLQKKLAALAAAAEEQIDWPRLLALCEKEPPALSGQAETPPARVRIAVAQDEAFCFTYAETLEALRDAGAEPVFFSPLRDASLPEKVGGLYLPGGYPELHARALSENTPLLREIKKRVEAGLPTVAECGGFLYLGQRLTDTAGQSWPMAGVLPGTAQDAGRLVRFGYAELGAEEDSMLFRAGEHFPIHEFHHWDSTANGTALTARKPVGGTEWRCGFANEHFYAGFPHLYWAGTPLPQRFAAAAEAYRRDHD